MAQRSLVIAIDGPAASGKGTLGRRLAEYLGLVYLDTGKLYRAVGYQLMQSGEDVSDAEDHHSNAAKQAIKLAEALEFDQLQNPELLQCEGVARAASIVSAIPGVREALLAFQRKVAMRPEGAVLDGRDIGTVVCPNADVKLFISAGLEARAERRFKELQKHDKACMYDAVLEDLRRRDRRDAERSSAPMKPAGDAIRIDTTHLGLDEVFDEVLSVIHASTSGNQVVPGR